jgi:integrase
MIYTIDELRSMLATSRITAVKNLISPTPKPLVKGDIERIETEVIARAPEGSDLAELFNLVRQVARDAKTPEKLLDKMRVVVQYPLPNNPFADGLSESEQSCKEARSWLENVCDRIASSQSKVSVTPGPALAFQLFVVSAVLEYRILHLDFVPAIIRSLKEEREFKIHSNGTIRSIPLSLNFGQQQNAERRLLILRQESAKRLNEFLALDQKEGFLRDYAGKARNTKPAALLESLECDAGKDPLVSPELINAKPPSLAALIDAARTMAMLEMPSVVVAHRSRRIVSHSLPPEVLGRIAGKELTSFPLARSDWSKANSVEDDPDAEVRRDEREVSTWIGELREALGEDQIDKTYLEHLAQTYCEDLKTMAKFAIYLEQPRGDGKVPAGGGCAHATVRRYCLLIATKVIPRLSAGALMEVTEDAWEDALQEILDEDVFYNVRKYAKQPNSNAQTYSRPLVKALRHWFQFLSQLAVNAGVDNPDPEDNLKDDNSDTDPANADKAANKLSGRGLIDLAKRLPVLGLVKVDASLITVDEYLEVLQRLVGMQNFAGSNDRSAASAALILGYRCGLRRAEVEWLRLSDFDRNNYLHVRPTEMRALKTSNARRDLPLELLVPSEELKRIRRRVSQVRALAMRKKIPLNKALLFSEADDPARSMDFNSGVLGKIRHAFRADERRSWKQIDPAFRFHRLRHSCATITLLRLWPELHGIARHIFGKRAKATLQWVIEDSKHFGERLMGTSITEVHLQAIALLLGHGSAATSLEHYLHVLDWYERPGTWG